MKAILQLTQEEESGPCTFWCCIKDEKGNPIAGKYGETREDARAKAIATARARTQAPLTESEEVEL